MSQNINGAYNYEAIIPEYLPFIHSIAAGFPERYREDLVQEGLIGLFNAVASYSPDAENPFKPYAVACIRNGIYSACRKIKNDALHESLEEAVIPAGDDMESSIIEKNDTSDFFAKLREELSPLEANILTEYLSDKTYAEIALALGVSAKTIDNSLTRIKGKIKKLYK